MSARTAALAIALGLVLPIAAGAPAHATTPAAGLVARAASALSTSAPERRRRRRRKPKKKRAPLTDRSKKDTKASSGGGGDAPAAAPGAAQPGTAQPGAAGGQGLGVRRSNRMEFDARLVQGERPKAGAVYLFERSPRRLPPLVKLRQSYVREIVVPVLGVDVWQQSAAAGGDGGAKGRKRSRGGK